MKRDFRFWITALAFSLPFLAALFIGSIYFSNCGINNNCAAGNLAAIIHTPIPTLFPATLPVPTRGVFPTLTSTPNQVAAASPTSEAVDEVPEPSNPGGPGAAVDLTGDPTTGATLFLANCATCHGDKGTGGVPNPGSNDGTVPPLNPIDPLLTDPDYHTFARNIDLFIQHGSAPEGTNPFRVMPAWGDKNALTQQQIADLIAYIIGLNPTAASAITPTAAATPASTATATLAIPRPYNPGGPGPGASLIGDVGSGTTLFAANCATCHGDQGTGGVANPGSLAGVVPSLNPINPLLKDPDPSVFAINLDLFIQHGSTPAGPGPFRSMPAWGDKNALTQQQIADLIAYIISLNK